MRFPAKLICLLMGLMVCFFLLPKSSSAQVSDPDDILEQNPVTPQDVDAGAGVQTTEPNAQGPSTQDVAGGGIIGPDYVLGPEDVLTITVFNLPEMTQTVRVENDGTVTIKLLGRIRAAGLTATQLRDELQKEWGENYLEDPHVTIFIKQFHARPVSVVGAVAKPGLYQLPGERTLVQVIAMAGGVNMPGTGTGNAVGAAPAGRWVYITRKDGFPGLKPMKGLDVLARDQIKVDLGRLLYTHDSALDIPIEAFDTVTVSKAGIVYVLGAVKRPGGFTLEDRDSLTALQALALAEGFTENPSKKHCKIIHTLSNGTRTEKTIDLGKIMKDKAKDPLLTANDILVVPDSTGKLIGKQGLSMGLGTLTGLIIWRGVL
ncbi:MAG: polysaccharide biosynthesis/export family protein [Terriglobia bacterium]